MDLDKTLLRDDRTISDFTVSILKQCQQKGIKIAFATARSTQASLRFLDQVKPEFFIGYGGALALAGNKVIQKFDISSNISFNLIKECLETSEISSIFAINESIALTNNPLQLELTDSSHYKYYNFSVNNNLSYLKISIISSKLVIVENIASRYTMLDMLRYTGEDLYRFANRNAVKWNAVKAVADYCNIDTNTLLSFGDDINDMEMIKNCGIGIAVENAIEGVKAVAKHICETNENDGVAKWLKKNVL
jgi:Cof subfamily protein (haloacid dehalogenase superfamily)